jgi:serine/threonine protein kinase
MNDVYEQKYLKYKKKYLKLKQLGGVINTNIKFVGSGSFGCLICPPLKLTTYVNENINYKIDGFSFDNITNCDYVGKIVALESQLASADSYEAELMTLLEINNLDPHGIYTPQLIYANKHKGSCLLSAIELLESFNLIQKQVLKCVKSKIKKEHDYGYLILKNAGITLHKKYIINNNVFDINELILFLNNYTKILEFIKILFDNNYLHLDIKIDNVTVKDNGELCLIDFGRTIKLQNVEDYHSIIEYLINNFFMYSFEPKLYYNLYMYFRQNNITKYSFAQLKELINANFKILIKPYDIGSDDMNTLHDILEYIFETDFENQLIIHDIDEYIYECQKNEFIKYLETYETNHDIDVALLLNHIFIPILKKIDMYCMGIILCQIVVINNNKYITYSHIFKNRFQNLIKSLLLNKFNNVDEFIHELKQVILELQWTN